MEAIERRNWKEDRDTINIWQEQPSAVYEAAKIDMARYWLNKYREIQEVLAPIVYLTENYDRQVKRMMDGPMACNREQAHYMVDKALSAWKAKLRSILCPPDLDVIACSAECKKCWEGYEATKNKEEE